MKTKTRCWLAGSAIILVIGWSLTAPAEMAIARIASLPGPTPVARTVIKLAEWYAAPVQALTRISLVARSYDCLATWWCEVLDAPETTP